MWLRLDGGLPIMSNPLLMQRGQRWVNVPLEKIPLLVDWKILVVLDQQIGLYSCKYLCRQLDIGDRCVRLGRSVPPSLDEQVGLFSYKCLISGLGVSGWVGGQPLAGRSPAASPDTGYSTSIHRPDPPSETGASPHYFFEKASKFSQITQGLPETAVRLIHQHPPA